MRFSHFLRGICLAWLLAVVSVLGIASIANAASNYGRSTYGNCTYGRCAQHTVVQTPSGLKVAINLTDGQVIPASGYTITITPLNGAGSSFKQAEIYIDGVNVATITPGQDGTARWQWDPTTQPGTKIEVRVTDTAGNTTTFNFTVAIGTVPATTEQGSGSAGGAPLAPAASGNQSFVARLLADFTQKATHVIKKLPAPVVYTFPYLLFVLLLIEILVLLLQTKRELHEVDTLRRLTAEEHEIVSLKQTFMALVSHYLRTPLTILQGGAEGLGQDGVPTTTITSLQAITKQLHSTIESLIATTESGAVVSNTQPTPTAKPRHLLAASGQVALWLPVVLVGCVAFSFVYLANHVTSFTTNTIGVLTQVVIYSILVLSLYQVARRWHLHRHDAEGAQKILAEERAVQELRDHVITQTADQLKGQVEALGAVIKTIPGTAANAKFVGRGFVQLNTVTSKFVIATHLRGARSSEPYAPVTLQSVYDRISTEITKTAAAKQVSITITNDTQFAMQNIGLLALVLQTVLDNAVAYSAEKGAVELAASAANRQTTITVTDHGSGVPADKQAALFQPFFKAEGAEQYNREGMGFSLYLDKLIMAYLGGDIALTSTPGATSVTLSLQQRNT